MSFEYVISQIAVVVFGVTAVLAVSHKGTDLFGVLVLGFITAVGGGTIRDLILRVPVFWTVDVLYVYASLGGAAVAFFFFRALSRSVSLQLLLYLDALGTAMFAIQGVHKTYGLGIGLPIVPVMMGVISAIGGSILRDMIAGRTNLLMRKELYANPVLLGCIVYIVLLYAQVGASVSGMVGIVVIFGLRSAAIYWGLTIPSFLILKSDSEQTPRFTVPKLPRDTK